MDISRQNCEKNYWKFVLILVVCLFVRLIPFRPPNIEPILAVQMPLAKIYGAFPGFFLGFLSIIFYDIITHTIGAWTIITAFSYGVLGLWAAYFFQKRQASSFNFVIFAIVGTLFFDAATGLSVGPLFFHQSFYSALVGQIPFTLLHLLGDIIFAAVLSPVVYRFALSSKKKLKQVSVVDALNMFHPKII